MNALDAAKRLRELLTPPERWTQKYLARDINGHSIEPTSVNAKCWCLMGGTVKIGPGTFGMKTVENVMDEEARAMGYDNYVALNDKAEHSTVLRLLDNTIKALKA